MLRLLCVAAALGSAAGQVTSECHWDSGRGATFDLSRLTKPENEPWEITDTDPETHDFVYVFNICANVGSPPKTFNHTSGTYTANGCDRTTGGHGSYLDGPSAAFQLSHNEDDAFCYHLNDDYRHGNFSLWDEADPAAGVVLTYTGGNKCAGGRERQLRLVLHCRDDEARAVNIPDRERVREPHNAPCLYEFNIKSGFGCPVECPIVADRPCGGNGVCGYDPLTKVSRCFCNTGKTGANCATDVAIGSTPIAGSALALVVVCALLVMVLIFLCYMWTKMRRLDISEDAYAALTGKHNELGQITSAPEPGNGFRAVGTESVDFSAN